MSKDINAEEGNDYMEVGQRERYYQLFHVVLLPRLPPRPSPPLHSPPLPSSLEDRFHLTVTRGERIEQVRVILRVCSTCPKISSETFDALRQTMSNP